jgi:hypothetical protein
MQRPADHNVPMPTITVADSATQGSVLTAQSAYCRDRRSAHDAAVFRQRLVFVGAWSD